MAGTGPKCALIEETVRRTRKPSAEPLGLILPLPVCELAKKHVCPRLGIQHVKHFGLVSNMLLEAKALLLRLQENRIPQRRGRLHRLGLVLQREAISVLELCKLPAHGTIEGPLKQGRQNGFE